MNNRLSEFLESAASSGDTSSGELLRVEVEVNASLEIAEIYSRIQGAEDSKQPILLFQQVADSPYPVVCHLLGTKQRIKRALSVDSLDEVSQRIFPLLGDDRSPGSSQGWWSKIQTNFISPGAEKSRPKTVKNAICQQVVRLGRDVELNKLPQITCGDQEKTATLTSALIISQGPETGEYNIDSFPVQCGDDGQLRLLSHHYHHLSRNIAACKSRQESLPVTVIFGGPLVMPVVAAFSLTAEPLSAEVDAYLLAGMMRDQSIELVKCRTNQLFVPAGCEIVIEGTIDPQAELVNVSTYACETGSYRSNQQAVAMSVDAMTSQLNAIMPATIFHPGPSEVTQIRHAVTQIVRPWIMATIPAVVDYEFPQSAMARQIAIVCIDKQQPHQARQVAAAWWGHECTKFTKMLVLVDREIDVHDSAAVMQAVATNARGSRDVFYHDGPKDPLDFSMKLGDNHSGGPQAMAIDATRKLPGEVDGNWEEVVSRCKSIQELVAKRWDEYGLR